MPASEGVSPISVKAFYGQPDFLENNLGIEEDPKLRDIVVQHQQQQQHKQMRVTDTDELLAKGLTTIAHSEGVEDEELTMEEALRYDEDSIPDENLTVNDSTAVDDDSTADAKSSAELANGNNCNDESLPVKTEVVPKTDVPSAATTACAQPLKVESMDAIEADAPDDKENITVPHHKPPTSPNRSPLGAAVAAAQSPPAPGSPTPAPAVQHNPVRVVPESPETFRRKESHLLKLGLITHEAAIAAKIEQERHRETMQATVAATATVSAGSGGAGGGNGGSSNGKGAGKKSTASGSTEYTGTLKTVIKLHRPSTSGVDATAATGKKKPGRQAGALKMTLHKGRGKGAGAAAAGSASAASTVCGVVSATGSNSHSDHSAAGSIGGDEDTYYTIQSEVSTTSKKCVCVPDYVLNFALCVCVCFYIDFDFVDFL